MTLLHPDHPGSPLESLASSLDAELLQGRAHLSPLIALAAIEAHRCHPRRKKRHNK